MRETYIVGVGMTPFGRFPATSLGEFAARASREALADAGLDDPPEAPEPPEVPDELPQAATARVAAAKAVVTHHRLSIAHLRLTLDDVPGAG